MATDPRLKTVTNLVEYARTYTDPGSALMALAEAEKMIGVEIAERVAALRRTGASWTKVGVPLGITRQAAQQRFGAPAKTKPDPKDPNETMPLAGM